MKNDEPLELMILKVFKFKYCLKQINKNTLTI